MLTMSKENHLSKTSAKHKQEQSRTRAGRVPVADGCGWMMSVREMEVEEEVMSPWIAVLFLAALCAPFFASVETWQSGLMLCMQLPAVKKLDIMT